MHACRVLQANEKVLFVTAWQMAGDTAQPWYARDDSYHIRSDWALSSRRQGTVFVARHVTGSEKIFAMLRVTTHGTRA